MVALLSIVGVRQANAYTTNELVSAGWTKVTSLTDVADNYYVLVDAGTSDYAMGRLSDGTDRPVYMRLADPMSLTSMVWILTEDGDNYNINSLKDNKYFISGTAGWNDSMNENKYDDEGRFAFTLAAGKYSIKSVKTGSWVGPWNNDNKVSLTDGYENIAANKSEDQAPGFILYSIPRTQYAANRINASWLTSNGWSQVTDNSALGNADNYYLIIEKETFGYAMARTSNGRPASKALSNPFNTKNELWVIAAHGSGYTLQNVVDNTYFTSAAGDWNTSMSNTPNADIIATVSDGVYTLSAGGTSSIGHWRDDKFFPYENENIAANKNDDNRNSYYIYTISKTDYDTQKASFFSTLAASATKDAPVNMTPLIFNNSDFANLAKLGWTTSGSAGNQQTGNGAFETWNSSNVSITQELTNIPAGKYGLTMQMVSGNDGRVPYLYANGKQEYTANVNQQATTATYDGMRNEIIANESYGLLTVNPFVSKGGNLTVGMKAPSGWVVFDNFRLYYYGPTIEGEAIELPANGAMAADTWYYIDVAIAADDYNATATTLGDIVYTTDGSILIEDQATVTTNFTATDNSLSATRYYVKSSTANTLAIEGSAPSAAEKKALADAILAAEANIIGFENGEYAPYNNIDAMAKLAAAKAINPETAVKAAVVAATTDLTGATWTANVGEVNAIRWIFADYTDNVDKQVPIGYTNGDGDAIRVSANYEANTGLNQLNQKMCLNINTNDKAAIYGETAGYTLPLKGSTYYKLTFRYAGWGNPSGTPTIKILKEDDSELKSVTLDPSSVQGNSATGPWTSATILFQTTVAGNYKVSFGKSGNRTVFGDLELKKAVADEVTISENADYTPAASEYADVTLTRTIKADTWNTFVVPFAINNTDLKAAFGADVSVAEYSEVADGDNSTVSFTTMETPAVAANIPVLLKTSTAGTSYTFLARTIVVGSAKVAGTNFDFVGNYNASLALENGDYFISSNNLYKKGEGSTVTLKGTRAYIMPKSSSVKILNFVIDDEIVTGVDSVEAAEAEEEGVLYNTAGQVVTEDYKGIVIKNGKKYYQK